MSCCRVDRENGVERGGLNSPSAGTVAGRTVAKANNQTSKWCAVAIAVGALIMIGAVGFGVAGLLKSHGVVSTPPWLSSAISVVGNTPHFWSLWAMTVGGAVIGGALVVLGACKVHASRSSQKLEVEQPEEAQEAPVEQMVTLSENERKQYIRSQMGDLFAEGKINRARFEELESSTYAGRKRNAQDTYIVARKHGGTLVCSARISQKESDELVKVLIADDYHLTDKKIPTTSDLTA